MSKKVMIIDDDENAVKFLSVVLGENGYETLSAYDGREGLAKLEQNDVDLIVLDVMMPKKTGFVLFKQLKKHKQLSEIPVLMLTGVAAALAEIDAESVDDTFARPYDGLRDALRKGIQNMRQDGAVRPEMFVDKPIDPTGFIEKVNKLIGS